VPLTEFSCQVRFNQLTKIRLGENSLEDLRIVSKRAFHDLPPGMYFYTDVDDPTKSNLHFEPELNRPGEWSLTKLGWFRFNVSAGGWHVNRCGINLKKMHHVKVSNCKQQLYTDSFDADFCLRDSDHRSRGNWDPENSDTETKVQSFLGRPINASKIWISEARPTSDGRHVLVRHREPPPVEIDFEMNTTVDVIHFLHHSSSLDDFRAEIRLDASSNRFLKIRLINAGGTMAGTLYETESKRTASFTFSVQAHARDSSEDHLISLPGSISTRRYVCLIPDANELTELCEWAPNTAKRRC
jgi:hypothetical protein